MGRLGQGSRGEMMTYNYYRSSFHGLEERVFTIIVGYCVGIELKKTRRASLNDIVRCGNSYRVEAACG